MRRECIRFKTLTKLSIRKTTVLRMRVQLFTVSNQWLKGKCRGGGTVISGFGPLLVVVGLILTVLDHFAPVGRRGPETTELTSLSSNHALDFES